MHTSGLLFLFWFLMLLFGIPQFRSEINNSYNNNVPQENYTTHVIYLIYFPCVIIMFLLNCIADKPPLETKHLKTDVSIDKILLSFFFLNVYFPFKFIT